MSSIIVKQRTGSIKLKQRSGSMKLKERTGRIVLNPPNFHQKFPNFGRNLFEDSANIFLDGGLNPDGSISGSNEYDKTIIEYALKKLDVGSKITISFDVEAVKGDTLKVYSTYNKDEIYFYPSHKFINFGSEKQRLSFTTQIVLGSIGPYKTRLEFYSEYGSQDYFTISKIKVEEGSQATPWTVAPEDLQKD